MAYSLVSAKLVSGSQSRVNGRVHDYGRLPEIGASWSWSGAAKPFGVARDGDADRRPFWDAMFTVTGADGTSCQIAVVDGQGHGLRDGALGAGHLLVFIAGTPIADTPYDVRAVFDRDAQAPKAVSDVGSIAADTMIEAVRGPVRADQLKRGDCIRTLSNGFRPLRWIGESAVEAEGAKAPVVISAGALGNSQELVVSPRHGLLIEDWRAQLYFGKPGVLVHAIDLVNERTIYRRMGGPVRYVQLLFDQHEIVFGQGIPIESLYPGNVALDAFCHQTLAEILDVFPELERDLVNYGPKAACSLRQFEARCLPNV